MILAFFNIIGMGLLVAMVTFLLALITIGLVIPIYLLLIWLVEKLP